MLQLVEIVKIQAACAGTPAVLPSGMKSAAPCSASFTCSGVRFDLPSSNNATAPDTTAGRHARAAHRDVVARAGTVDEAIRQAAFDSVEPFTAVDTIFEPGATRSGLTM